MATWILFSLYLLVCASVSCLVNLQTLRRISYLVMRLLINGVMWMVLFPILFVLLLASILAGLVMLITLTMTKSASWWARSGRTETPTSSKTAQSKQGPQPGER